MNWRSWTPVREVNPFSEGEVASLLKGAEITRWIA